MEYKLKNVGQVKQIIRIVFLTILVIWGFYTGEIHLNYMIYFIFGILYLTHSYFKNRGNIKITDEFLILNFFKETSEFDFNKIRQITISSTSNRMLRRDILCIETNSNSQNFTISQYNVELLESILVKLCQKYEIEYDRNYCKL